MFHKTSIRRQTNEVLTDAAMHAEVPSLEDKFHFDVNITGVRQNLQSRL